MDNINIVLDINNQTPNYVQPFNPTVGDGGLYQFTVNIVNSGVPFDLTNLSAKITFGKADGTSTFSSMTIASATSGIATYIIQTNDISFAGNVNVEIVIYGTDASKLTSSRFSFNVKTGVLSDSTVESTNEFSALTAALNTVNGIENKADKTYVDTQDTALSDKIGNLSGQGLTETDLATAIKNDRSSLADNTQRISYLDTNKADITYVNTKTQANNLAYKESFNSLADLQTTYPSGDTYNHSVLIDTTYFIYTWSNGEWINTNIQANGTGIADESINYKQVNSYLKKSIYLEDVASNYNWVFGTIDVSTGLNNGSPTNRVKSDYIKVYKNTLILNKISNTAKLAIYLYSLSDKSYISGIAANNTELKFINQDCYIKIVMLYNDNSNITDIPTITNNCMIIRPSLDGKTIQENTITSSSLSDELAFKSNNLITNGDFNYNVSGWTALNAYPLLYSPGAKSAKLVFNTNTTPRIYQTFNGILNHKYYIKCGVTMSKVGILSKCSWSLASAESGTGNFIDFIGDIGITKTYMSGIVNGYLTGLNYLRLSIILNGTQADNVDLALIDDIIVCDLTLIFGEGNEPSSLEMDNFLSKYPNGWFNSTEGLFSLEDIYLNLNKKLSEITVNVSDEMDITEYMQDKLNETNTFVLEKEGIFYLSDVVKIPSNTYIRLGSNTTIKLANNINKVFFENSDPTNGNENIHIEGGIWDGNKDNQAFDTTKLYGIFRFAGVTKLYLGNLTIKDPVAFGTQFCRITNYLIENIIFDIATTRINQDGIHLGGECYHGRIRNIRGNTGDDMIALNADDYVEWRFCNDVYETQMINGAIVDLEVDGVQADNGYRAMRLLSGTSFMDDIKINNVSGGFDFGILIGRWKATGWQTVIQGDGNIGRIQLSHLSFTTNDSVVLIDGNSEYYQISDLSFDYSGRTTTMPIIEVQSNDITVKHMNIRDMYLKNTPTSSTKPLVNNGIINDLIFDNFISDTVQTIQNNGTITKFRSNSFTL